MKNLSHNELKSIEGGNIPKWNLFNNLSFVCGVFNFDYSNTEVISSTGDPIEGLTSSIIKQ